MRSSFPKSCNVCLVLHSRLYFGCWNKAWRILEAIVCVEVSSTLFHAFTLLQRKDTAQEKSNPEDITSIEKESFTICHNSSTVISIHDESIWTTRAEVDGKGRLFHITKDVVSWFTQ
jgi:hypothetical protein